MAPHRTAEGAPARQHGADVVAADLIKEGVLHQHGQHGEVARHVTHQRQKHVIETILDLLAETHGGKTVRLKTGHRKPRPKVVHRSAKQHLQHHTQREGRHRISGKNQHTRGHVKRRSLPKRLGNAQRNADQVREHKAGNAEDQGDTKTLTDDLPRRFVRILVRLHAESESIIHQPCPVPFVQRSVKSVMLFQLRPVILTQTRDRAGSRGTRLPFAHAAHLLHHLLHRTAGNKLHHGEADHGDTQKSRDHQQ